MPVLGQPSCAPVGWHDCPDGFVPSPSGWGCAASLASTACTGSTRDTLASRCVAVGDCSRPFPPREATRFVSASFADEQLDARHFRTVRAAVEAAAAHEVIAIDAGAYVETIALNKPVSLVGRCPEQVVLTPPLPNDSGLFCTSKVAVSGLRLDGFDTAVAAFAGCDAALSDLVIENSGTLGIWATERANVVVRGSVVRGTRASRDENGYYGIGIGAADATVAVEASAVTSSVDTGVNVSGTEGLLTLSDSVIRDIRFNPRRQFAAAVHASAGAVLSVRRSAVHDVFDHGIRLEHAGTRASNRQAWIASVKQAAPGRPSGGLLVTGAEASLDSAHIERVQGTALVVYGERGSLRMQRSVVRDTRSAPLNAHDFGMGMYLIGGASAEVEASAFVDNRRSGIEVRERGTSLSLSRSLIAGTRHSGEPARLGGWGLLVPSGSATVVESALLDNRLIGVQAELLASLHLTRTIVAGTRSGPLHPGVGHGIMVRMDTATRLEEVLVEDNESAGLVFSETPGIVRGSYVSNNGVGIHVLLTELREGDHDAPGPRVVSLDAATEFVGNGSRVGSGELILPEIPETAPR